MTIIRDQPPEYHAYVLRCWEVRSQHPDRPTTWRFSLEDARTRQRHTIPDLETLLAFLQAALERHEGWHDEE